MNHFLLALVSQFHVLHFFVFLLLLDFVSLLLIVLVLAQSFSSQFLNLLAFLLLLSLRIPYSPFLLSPFPELQPLLAPLLFSEPASLILLYVIFQHFLLLLSHQVSVFLLQVSVFPLSLLVHASLHVFVFLHLSSLQVSVSLHLVSVFLHPSSLQVSVSLHPVSVFLHPVSSSSSFALYLPLSSMD